MAAGSTNVGSRPRTKAAAPAPKSPTDVPCDPNLLILLELDCIITELVGTGTLIERDIGGIRCIGLRHAVDCLEKEIVELEFSPRHAAEVMLYQAALKTQKKEVLGSVSWAWTNPNVPSQAALIEWFELNHPAEAKQITRDFTTGNFADDSPVSTWWRPRGQPKST